MAGERGPAFRAAHVAPAPSPAQAITSKLFRYMKDFNMPTPADVDYQQDGVVVQILRVLKAHAEQRKFKVSKQVGWDWNQHVARVKAAIRPFGWDLRRHPGGGDMRESWSESWELIPLDGWAGHPRAESHLDPTVITRSTPPPVGLYDQTNAGGRPFDGDNVTPR
jgi:hypothetical protein